MVGLTKRQGTLLNFLKKFIEVKGYCPSYEEIGNHMGITSSATVFKHVRNLQERGYIVCHPGVSRSIEVIEVDDRRFTLETDSLLWDKQLKCYWRRTVGESK